MTRIDKDHGRTVETARLMAFSLVASWLRFVERRTLDFLYRWILTQVNANSGQLAVRFVQTKSGLEAWLDVK